MRGRKEIGPGPSARWATEQTRGDGGTKVMPVGVPPRFLRSNVKECGLSRWNSRSSGERGFGIGVRESGGKSKRPLPLVRYRSHRREEVKDLTASQRYVLEPRSR